MGEAFLFGNGGGSGYPVTVRHCGANATVTAYKGNSQEMEGTTANADGVAVFEKLGRGIWTFTSSVFSSQRTVQIKGATTTSILPSEYREVEYLESTGAQYIDTSVNQNGNAGFKIDCMMPAEIVQSALIGSYINGGVNGGVIRQKSDGKPYFQYGTTSTISEYALTNNIFSARHVYEFNSTAHKNAFYIDGVSKISSATAGNTGLSFYLFAAHVSGTGATNPNGIAGVKRIFSCEIYASQVLKRAFVPCVDNNGVGGMYDLAGGRFYTNSGTGDFNVGEEVEQNANGMVIYSAPVGLTVTATKGGESLTPVKTLIGDKELHIFVVKPQYFGEITVTADDKVQTVIIDSNITVMLTHVVYLYKDGNEYSAITGGWRGQAARAGVASATATAPSVIKNADNIVASLNSSAAGGVLSPTNKINISNYSRLKFSGNINSKAQYAIAGFYILDDLSYWSDRAVAKVATSNTNTITNGEIDISALNGEYYIAFGLYHNASVQITETWLE